MNKVSFQVMDVFSEKPFSGTQIAVIFEAAGLGEEACSKIAAELNLPLTVFLESKDDGRRLEVFSPRGRGGCLFTAALAAAAAAGGAARFAGPRGELEVGASQNGVFFLTAQAPAFSGYHYRKELLCGLLGLDRYRLPDHWPLGLVKIGEEVLVVPVVNREALDDLHPDYHSLARLLEKLSARRAVLYTWQGTADLYLRSFAPGLGVFEEPLSAAGALAAAALAVKEKALPLTPPLTRLTVVGGIKMGRPARSEVEVSHQAQQIEAVGIRAVASRSFSGEI
jgi:trans-2,3-dihydro-3-hydroxyanthranilate isomerase